MKIETVAPHGYLGDAVGVINCRRGSVQDQSERRRPAFYRYADDCNT